MTDDRSFKERTDIVAASDPAEYLTTKAKVAIDLSNLDPMTISVSSTENANIHEVSVRFLEPQEFDSGAMPRGLPTGSKRVQAVFTVKGKGADEASDQLRAAIGTCSARKR